MIIFLIYILGNYGLIIYVFQLCCQRIYLFLKSWHVGTRKWLLGVDLLSVITLKELPIISCLTRFVECCKKTSVKVMKMMGNGPWEFYISSSIFVILGL